MANALTLLMPIVPGSDAMKLGGLILTQQAKIDEALQAIGTVHFARFVILDTSAPNLQPSKGGPGPFVLGVITEYDGDFALYISDFVNKIGFVFDAVLPFVVGGSALVPVAQNLNAFTTFVARNDAAQNPLEPGLYGAYPDTVVEILANG